MRNDIERLEDAREFIEKIEKYAHAGKDVFDCNELVQGWVIYNMMLLGEAISGLSKDFRDANPEFPWREIRDFRNTLIHGYYDISPERVWKIVDKDLPSLKKAISTILKTE